MRPGNFLIAWKKYVRHREPFADATRAFRISETDAALIYGTNQLVKISENRSFPLVLQPRLVRGDLTVSNRDCEERVLATGTIDAAKPKTNAHHAWPLRTLQKATPVPNH